MRSADELTTIIARVVATGVSGRDLGNALLECEVKLTKATRVKLEEVIMRANPEPIYTTDTDWAEWALNVYKPWADWRESVKERLDQKQNASSRSKSRLDGAAKLEIKNANEYRAKTKKRCGAWSNPSKLTYASGAITHPKISPTYLVGADVEALWNGILYNSMYNEGRRAFNVKLTGDPGTGKSESAIQFAAHAGLGFVKIDCGNITEASDLWGRLEPVSDGSGIRLQWVDSPLAVAVETGNVTILLDELTRLPYSAQNGLLPILDGIGSVTVPGRDKPIERGKNVFFFAAVNEGSKHAGTVMLTAALESRFDLTWEQTTLSKDLLFMLAEFAVGTKPLMDANVSIVDGVEYEPHGITENEITAIIGIVDAVRELCGDSANGISLTPSTREYMSMINAFTVWGASGIRWALLNRYSPIAIAGDSPREQIKKKVDLALATSSI